MSSVEDTVARREVVVEAPMDRAFTTFVERFGDFKPREHNILAAPIAETTFEPRVGGHIYDRGEDGSECRHGPGWEAVRDGVAHDEGWTLYLNRYAGLLIPAA